MNPIERLTTLLTSGEFVQVPVRRGDVAACRRFIESKGRHCTAWGDGDHVWLMVKELKRIVV